MRQINCFIVSGCTAVTTDLASYQLLLTICPVGVAKGISFLCGTLIAYLLNKYWTFQRDTRSWPELVCFLMLYTGTLCLNVTIHHLSLQYLPGLIAFLAATATSTVVNFLGQKFWVFKPSFQPLNPQS